MTLSSTVKLTDRKPGADSSERCARCCVDCQNNRASHYHHRASSSQGNPFALKNLFAAGTLNFDVLPSSLSSACDHCHAEDDWHELIHLGPLLPIAPLLVQDALRDLHFLVLHRFVRATYRIRESDLRLIIRLYIIPSDLTDSEGKLAIKNRDGTIETRGGKIFSRLFPQVSRNKDSWTGLAVSHFVLSDDPLFPQSEFDDQRSLTEIFNDLSTASIVANLSKPKYLRTHLYKYQEETVSTMLRMEEEENRVINNPLFVSVDDLYGKRFFLQPSSFKMRRNPEPISQIRGGILCEELGTGKTVMILALIAATLDQLPKPPDGNEVFSPLSYLHFPYAECKEARKETYMLKKRRKTDGMKEMKSLPTLVEILSHNIRTTSKIMPLRAYETYLTDRGLWEPICSNAPFYFQNDLLLSEISDRRSRDPAPRVMYLSSATLIVVPANLVGQWRHEIMKHCTTSLRVFPESDEKTERIPDPAKLATDYDIVLLSYTKITNEAQLCDIEGLRVGFTCRCAPYFGSRVPACKCKSSSKVSSLLSIYWKRIVRDEGHNSAAVWTNINTFLCSLRAERRWIVTGTPTTNLLGLNFGSGNEASLLEDECSTGYEVPVIGQVVGSFVETSNEEMDIMDMELVYPNRVWTQAERADLRKLGLMMEQYLAIPQFTGEKRAFESFVMAPLFGEKGSRPGAVKVLTQVLETILIRHRVKDIEAYVSLPPLKEETVLLDLDPYALKTYNVLQASVVVNAVDSERVGADYLFHPRNEKLLNTSIETLSQTLFWHFDSNAFDWKLEETIRNAQEAIVNARKRERPDSDILLLKAAVKHLRLAYNDKTFKAMQHGFEIFYRVHGSPPELAPLTTIGSEVFMRPSALLQCKKHIERQPIMSSERLEKLVWIINNEEEKRNALFEHRERRKSKKKRKDVDSPEKARIMEVRKTLNTKEKELELEKEFLEAKKLLQALSNVPMELDHSASPTGPEGSTRSPHISSERARILRSSRFADMTIGNSTSSKLNYILREVQMHSSSEKFLIFSTQPYTLAHVSEGLELIGVKYLHFSTDVDQARREQHIRSFETGDNYKVLLMELRYGARGLNLVAASRIIFCEPVWQADVESQAIKRAHRIGQSKPVTVTTLAIRSTFEEVIVNKRSLFKWEGGKQPPVTSESGIRHFLEHPLFMERDPEKNVDLKLPFLDIPVENESQSISQEHTSTMEFSFDNLEPLSPNSIDLSLSESAAQAGTFPFKVRSGLARLAYHLDDEDDKSHARSLPVIKRRKVVQFA